jgi:RNA-splicing ligase RtcB
VGVDIGCGMIAVETDLTAEKLPDDLDRFQPMVAKAVPAGLGKWHARATHAAEDWFTANPPPRDLGGLGKRAMDQFGTLGSGNHFFETHEGRELWITRKGAIRADVTDHGVIPGSMGTRSYIVRGKGNAASYRSCSHGAGRRLSRSQARKRFTVDDMAAQMADTPSWQRDSAADLIDEIPAAYKDVEQVMADQADLVEVEHALHQILNYKGTDSGRRRRR